MSTAQITHLCLLAFESELIDLTRLIEEIRRKRSAEDVTVQIALVDRFGFKNYRDSALTISSIDQFGLTQSLVEKLAFAYGIPSLIDHVIRNVEEFFQHEALPNRIVLVVADPLTYFGSSEGFNSAQVSEIKDSGKPTSVQIDNKNSRSPFEYRNHRYNRIALGLESSTDLQKIFCSELTRELSSKEELLPNPYSVVGLSQFIKWSQSVAPDSKTGTIRSLDAVYTYSNELQSRYPRASEGNTAGIERWATSEGRAETQLLRIFPYPRRRGLSAEILPGNQKGVDVVGFLRAEHGIGEASRLLVRSLETVNVPMSKVSYTDTTSRQQVDIEVDRKAFHNVGVLAVNADVLPPLMSHPTGRLLRDRYLIGQWFWELEKAPKWYANSYQYLNELWAPTRFIEAMLRRSAPKNVVITRMPLPVLMPIVNPEFRREQLGIDERFMFLFLFDYWSSMERKNPIGVIEAFKLAFAENEGPILVIKTVNGRNHLSEQSALLTASKDRSDIFIIDRYLESSDNSALIQSSDCYISLHRSEGLGLTMAEAMLLKTPVIATGYSGNMDFTNSQNCALVKWKYKRVGRKAHAYDKRAKWADPDLNEAALMMQRMYRDEAYRDEISMLAYSDMVNKYNIEVCGKRMRARLEEIWSSMAVDV